MEFTEQQKEKLEQAKELLTALGLPKAQCNGRSGWVLLALANIKPSDSWHTARACKSNCVTADLDVIS